MQITQSKTEADLLQIINLQKDNLSNGLSNVEKNNQGFVTVSHSLKDLLKMQQYEQNVILKDKDKIVGYLLAMTKNSKLDLPILIPMFEIFDEIYIQSKKISEYNYLVVGQVCIEKSYRGMGLLDKMYTYYKNVFQNKYDFAITEISTENKRSIKAHQGIGFEEIYRYTDANLIQWSIVLWKWNIKNI